VSEFIPLRHPRFRRVQRDIFERRVVADCMTHRCCLLTEGGREKLDACCQYGVDVDVAERDAILARREQIDALLDEDVRGAAWFSAEESDDADFPSGRFVRTRTHADGCIFLAHDGRGCAIHRASIEGDWDFRGTKPHVCRLFPLSYDSESIVLSDDYPDYSCSLDPSAPTVYRVGRADLGDIFGADLVAALDAVEARHLASLRRLPVIP
jgi:Fe-S-cluster containining protein